MTEMDSWQHNILHKVQQKYLMVIADTICIEDEFSIYRSLRRGANTKARNEKIPQDITNANLRWRKVMQSQGMIAGITIQKQYTDLSANVPTLVIFS